MRKMFFRVGLGLLALAGMTWSVAAAAPAEKTLHGHVPPIVARLVRSGELAATNDLHLAIGLQLRNQAAMEDLLRQVTDPASPNYQHYLTPQEFTDQFAPSESDYQAVIAFAHAHSLAITATSSNRMLLQVSGKASDVQKAFKVSLHTYRHPTENRTFFAPDTEPTVPGELAILDVSGLESYSRPHTHLHLRSSATNTPAGLVSHQGTGLGGSYMGSDFRNAYAPGVVQTGAGQKVALVQFDGYFASDIATYENLAGLPSVALTNILLNGFSGYPTFTGGELEVSLDLEMVVSMAPGLNEILVYEGNPAVFLPNVVLNQIASDNAAHQVSSSWGWSGGPSATSDQIFKEMILQGQTYYNASGDNDAFLPGEVDNPGYTGFPSSDPFVIEVGATTLTTTNSGASNTVSYVSETVWNWDIEYGPTEDGVGSSGGISSYYAIPWWQTNTLMTANGGSTLFRNIPDVAMVGDNVLVIADGGVFYPGVGGTSCAAPLWGALTALVNQQSASLGRSSVGFINPTLYALSRGQYYNGVFNDITNGNNTWSASTNFYFAVTNYDLCTGLGTPKAAALIAALTSITNVPASLAGLIPAPAQPWGTTLSVMSGSNPNGYWLLYDRNQSQSYGGTNYNGWMVNLTTADPVGYTADNQLTVNTTVNSQFLGDVTNVTFTPGSTWQMTLAETNYGPSISSNVFVLDTLPGAPGVTVISSNATAGSITAFGGNLVWNLGNLPVNAGGTLNLNLRANAAGLYTNSATVNASTLDPNSDDDSITVIASVAVTTAPAIQPRFTAAGGAGGFQLSVLNDANSTVIIQASSNLVTWVPVFTNMAPFTFTNFDSTNYQKRFYRALISQ